VIHLELITEIAAPLERCFDLARSIDLHTKSTSWTGEQAIAGVTSGMIGLGQEVTWEGRHFGLTIQHTSRITEYDRPRYFQDQMIKGRFRSFCHDHFFEQHEGKTLMRDVVRFEAPLGFLGRVAERLILENHIREFLLRRNEHIRHTAEREDWKVYLV
jgi:ligand-binding SRPBCC domain-containing protein